MVKSAIYEYLNARRERSRDGVTLIVGFLTDEILGKNFHLAGENRG